MPRPLLLPSIMRRFIAERDGNIALLFGLMLVPLALAAGAGVDYAQAQSFKNSLQGAVDAAALAGASVYTATSGTSSTAVTVATNFMNNAIKTLPPNQGVTFTVAPASVTSGSSTVGYTVAVSASGKVSNAFMALASISTTAVSVAATAENPVTTVSVSTSGFSSSACDGNSIYWYLIPSTATPSTYVPPSTALNELWSNVTTITPKSFTLSSSSQQIGFALENVTGEKCTYGNNSYGGKQGATHMFYSNLFPPSKDAYPSETQNRSLQVVPLPTGGTLASVLASLPETGFSSNSTNAAPTCGAINGQTYVYAWNDMGGTSDDLDYNDAAYTFTCSGASGSSSSGASGVVLIK